MLRARLAFFVGTALAVFGSGCRGETVGPPLGGGGDTGGDDGGTSTVGATTGGPGSSATSGTGSPAGAGGSGAGGGNPADGSAGEKDQSSPDGPRPPDDGGGPPSCTAPSCTPSLLVQVGTAPGSVSRAIYINGTVLDGKTIYAVAQVIGPAGTVLTPTCEVSAIDVTSGSRMIVSGADEYSISGDTTVVAADATDVYWFSRSRGTPELLSLRKLAKGTRNVQSIGSLNITFNAQKVMFGFTVGATDVYWGITNDGIYHCAKTDCSSPTLLKALSDHIPALIELGSYIYWGSATQGDVWRRGLSGPMQGVEERLAMGPMTGPAAVCGFAVDGPSLFWAQCDGAHEVHVINTMTPSDTRLAFVPEDQGSTGETHGSVAVDAQSAYFLGSKYAYRVPRSGGRPQAIGVLDLKIVDQSVELNRMIGVDANFVYLLATAQAAIFKLQK
jgi:hypothetical protein